MKSTYYYNKVKIFLIGLFIAFNCNSCKKLATVAPPATALTGASIYLNDATAAAVLTGIYDKFAQGSFATASNGASLSVYLGSSADELQGANFVGIALQYYQNSLTNTSSTPWGELYSYLHTTNVALEGLSTSNSLTPAVKQQLIGEAKFVRAFLHFYLTNLYGDIPLVTTGNYAINNTLSRTPQAQVYQQIITDLQDAQKLLSSNYLAADITTTTTDKVRPTKWAATALLARVYLYTKQWVDAETQTNALISQYSLSALNSVFLKNSSEAIWQLMPVSTTSPTNTLDGYFFILTTINPPSLGNSVFINNNLLNAFEPLDGRRTSWVSSYTSGTQTYYFPFKYKVGVSTGTPTEYLMVLRLAEQYLIRAEARAQQNNFTGAAADLNVIRNRAGLPNTTATTQAALLTAILHERQVELFTEWGHRWLDLKRTGTVDAIMSVITPQKGGGAWNTTKQLFPVPQSDIQLNPNLTQNQGY